MCLFQLGSLSCPTIKALSREFRAMWYSNTLDCFVDILRGFLLENILEAPKESAGWDKENTECWLSQTYPKGQSASGGNRPSENPVQWPGIARMLVGI